MCPGLDMRVNVARRSRVWIFTLPSLSPNVASVDVAVQVLDAGFRKSPTTSTVARYGMLGANTSSSMPLKRDGTSPSPTRLSGSPDLPAAANLDIQRGSKCPYPTPLVGAVPNTLAGIGSRCGSRRMGPAAVREVPPGASWPPADDGHRWRFIKR